MSPTIPFSVVVVIIIIIIIAIIIIIITFQEFVSWSGVGAVDVCLYNNNDKNNNN